MWRYNIVWYSPWLQSSLVGIEIYSYTDKGGLPHLVLLLCPMHSYLMVLLYFPPQKSREQTNLRIMAKWVDGWVQLPLWCLETNLLSHVSSKDDQNKDSGCWEAFPEECNSHLSITVINTWDTQCKKRKSSFLSHSFKVPGRNQF